MKRREKKSKSTMRCLIKEKIKLKKELKVIEQEELPKKMEQKLKERIMITPLIPSYL